MTPAEVASVLARLKGPWWIAGGWAVDLHVGHQTREHADIDVVILREDQGALHHALPGWDLHAADPPGSLRPWPSEERLPDEVHDIWCRRTPRSPWSLQVMIDDARAGVWTYRRDPRISRPVADLDGRASNARRRVLTPEVQLLYKSRDPRPKDHADLVTLQPHLDADQRSWLRVALPLVCPGHPWLELL